MERVRTPAEDVDKSVAKSGEAADSRQQRADATLATATQPTSGAAVQHAVAGAELAGEPRAADASETADAIKRAAENDRRP